MKLIKKTLGFLHLYIIFTTKRLCAHTPFLLLLYFYEYGMQYASIFRFIFHVFQFDSWQYWIEFHSSFRVRHELFTLICWYIFLAIVHHFHSK